MTKNTLDQNRLAASLKITLGICVIGLAGCSRTHVSPYAMNYAPGAYASSLQNSVHANMRQQTQPAYYALYNDQANSAVNRNGYSPMATTRTYDREYPALRPAHSYERPTQTRYAKQSMQTMRQIRHMPAMHSMQMQQLAQDMPTDMPTMDRYMQDEQYGLYATRMPQPMPHQRPAMLRPHMNSYMGPQTTPHMEPQMRHMETQAIHAAPSAQETKCMAMEVGPQNTQTHPNFSEQASLYCGSENIQELAPQQTVAEHFHDPITGEIYLPKMAVHAQATQM